jgi:hypothetical protein
MPGSGHPRFRINRLLRVMLHTRWSAEAWSVVRVEFRRALALRSEIRRAGFVHLIATSAPADIVGRSATEESTNERGN